MVLLAGCGVGSLGAQTPAQMPSQTAAGLPLPAKFASAKRIERPTASMMPSAKARLSTAERMAAVNKQPPLQELPNFAVNDQDGKPVSAKALSRSTHWILVYRRQNCLPCDRLMNVLAASGSSGLGGGKPYVILVAGKASDAVDRVRANYSTLSQATWLADKDDRAFAALKPRGAPMIYAMDGQKIVWSVPGNLGNPAKVEKMTAAWMTSGGTSAAKVSSTAGSSSAGSGAAGPGAAAAPATK
jgi:hypothetical protein